MTISSNELSRFYFTTSSPGFRWISFPKTLVCVHDCFPWRYFVNSLRGTTSVSCALWSVFNVTLTINALDASSTKQDVQCRLEAVRSNIQIVSRIMQLLSFSCRSYFNKGCFKAPVGTSNQSPTLSCSECVQFRMTRDISSTRPPAFIQYLVRQRRRLVWIPLMAGVESEKLPKAFAFRAAKLMHYYLKPASVTEPTMRPAAPAVHMLVV